MTSEELLRQSINALKEVIDVEASLNFDYGQTSDATAKLRFRRNGHIIEKTFGVEIKPSIVTRSVVGQLAELQMRSSRRLLLVTRYVSPPIAEQLKELEIAFIDAVGNAYINEPELFIYINSRAKDKENQVSKPSILFQASSLKLIFVLLSKPHSENRSYRELAELSGTSLGYVSEIISNLQRENYLVSRNEERMLLRKDKLLQRWVQGYAERLRPKLRKINFQASSENWWQDVDLNQIECQWGGDVAAHRMTGYLIPNSFTLYSRRLPVAIRTLMQLGHRRQPKGNIEILERFWSFENESEVVPPLLVYADLIHTAKERHIETAQIIYDDYLAQLTK